MKIAYKIIKEDKFDMLHHMRLLNISFRELSKVVKINATHLNRIANGLPATEETALKIKYTLSNYKKLMKID